MSEKHFFPCWWWICRLSVFLSVSVWALSGIWQLKPVEPRTPSHRKPVEPVEPCLKGQFSQISFDIWSEYDDHKLLEFVLFSLFFPLSALFLTFAKSFQARLLQRGSTKLLLCANIRFSFSAIKNLKRLRRIEKHFVWCWTSSWLCFRLMMPVTQSS